MIVLLVISIAVNAALAGAAVSSDFARKLIELRSEVEEAGTGYEEAIQKRKAALEPVQMRHSELESQIAKEELRSLQLKEKLKAARAGTSVRSQGQEGEWAILENWAKKLTAYVQATIPFRRKERLERANALEERIQQKRDSRINILNDLWNVTEKELALTKDVEYRIGKLPLAGVETDGEIARLGMAHLLFISPEASGYSKITKGKWDLVATYNSAEKEAIERIVSRLKSKSANGWYEIPGLQSIPREETE